MSEKAGADEETEYSKRHVSVPGLSCDTCGVGYQAVLNGMSGDSRRVEPFLKLATRCPRQVGRRRDNLRVMLNCFHTLSDTPEPSPSGYGS